MSSPDLVELLITIPQIYKIFRPSSVTREGVEYYNSVWILYISYIVIYPKQGMKP